MRSFVQLWPQMLLEGQVRVRFLVLGRLDALIGLVCYVLEVEAFLVVAWQPPCMLLLRAHLARPKKQVLLHLVRFLVLKGREETRRTKVDVPLFTWACDDAQLLAQLLMCSHNLACLDALDDAIVRRGPACGRKRFGSLVAGAGSTLHSVRGGDGVRGSPKLVETGSLLLARLGQSGRDVFRKPLVQLIFRAVDLERFYRRKLQLHEVRSRYREH